MLSLFSAYLVPKSLSFCHDLLVLLSKCHFHEERHQWKKKQENLSRGDHSGQESGVQSEGGSSRKKPAVTWEERLGLREWGKKAQGGEAERGMEGEWWRGVGQRG